MDNKSQQFSAEEIDRVAKDVKRLTEKVSEEVLELMKRFEAEADAYVQRKTKSSHL